MYVPNTALQPHGFRQRLQSKVMTISIYVLNGITPLFSRAALGKGCKAKSAGKAMRSEHYLLTILLSGRFALILTSFFSHNL